jgi:hypothetical protein
VLPAKVVQAEIAHLHIIWITEVSEREKLGNENEIRINLQYEQ